MANSIPLAQPIGIRAAHRTAWEMTAIRWYIWCCMLSVVFSVAGIEWDISWHKSIGRDSFWMATQPRAFFEGND